ncbi:MAG: LysR family transcriptional regulator [Arsenicicoccus sp.]|nr:MAG: LysR family transcriptional regulator [Arsenicicoccus sp.]
MDLLRHCSYVLAVVDEGSFTDAAISLGITQPPLSQGVRRLEERWGVRLLDRSARGVGLTAEGRRLLPVLRSLVADAEALERRARELGRDPGDLVCGVDPALAGLTEAVLARLAERSRVPVRPRPGTPEVLVDALRGGEIDLALVRHPCVTDGVHAGAPVTVRTALVRPAARETHDAFPVPRGLSLVLRPREEAPAAHDLLWHECLRAGHDGPLIEAEHGALAWVAAGAGWTLLPWAALPAVPETVVVTEAPPRLSLRAVVVAREEEVGQQAHAVLAGVARGADGG